MSVAPPRAFAPPPYSPVAHEGTSRAPSFSPGALHSNADGGRAPSAASQRPQVSCRRGAYEGRMFPHTFLPLSYSLASLIQPSLFCFSQAFLFLSDIFVTLRQPSFSCRRRGARPVRRIVPLPPHRSARRSLSLSLSPTLSPQITLHHTSASRAITTFAFSLH